MPRIKQTISDIDRTLIRENLELSVEERLRKLAALQQFAIELRRAGQAAREKMTEPVRCPRAEWSPIRCSKAASGAPRPNKAF